MRRFQTRGASRPVGVGIAILILASPVGLAAAGASSAHVSLKDPRVAQRLRHMIDSAWEWMGEEACQQVLTDFVDASGRSLASVLEERGLSFQEQVERVFFYDGSSHRRCVAGGREALTTPGSNVVYVCPREIAKLSRDPFRSSAVIIHELLHTLGLDENPPTSREITARVLERCLP